MNNMWDEEESYPIDFEDDIKLGSKYGKRKKVGVFLKRDFQIEFSDDINTESVFTFSNILDKEIRKFKFNKIKNGIEIPIKINFTTEGGSILEGLNLINKLKSLTKNNIPFILNAKGYLFGMGLIVFASFDEKKRSVEDNTIFGTLEYKGSIYGSSDDAQNQSEYLKNVMPTKLIRYMCELYGKDRESFFQEFLYTERIFNSFDEIEKAFKGGK